MRVRYTRRAFTDREAIYNYLDERSPKGAVSVQRAIDHTIRALEAYPRLGQLTNFADIHELAVPRYPYKVYYRVEGDEIWIRFSIFAMRVVAPCAVRTCLSEHSPGVVVAYTYTGLLASLRRRYFVLPSLSYCEMKAQRSLISFSFLMPAKAILVPGIFALGSLMYSLNWASFQVMPEFLLASE
jgi:toxin ParE1/3/4